MLAPTQILDRYAWLYSSVPQGPTGTWDEIIQTDGGTNGLRLEDDGSVGVYIHGSEDLSDWEHDFDHVALPVDDPDLGPVHPGFLDGALEIKPEIDKFAGAKPVQYFGHSYGAGRAALLAGMRLKEGRLVQRVVLFGAPR